MSRLPLVASLVLASVTLTGVAFGQSTPLPDFDTLCTQIEAGRVAPEHAADVVIVFTQECDAARAEGCRGLATLYREGVGVDVDAARAAALDEQACALGSPSSCLAYAEALVASGAGGDDRDLAYTYFEASCADGDARGCLGQARMLGFPSGHQPDRVEAERLLQDLCDAGDDLGCTTLGELYRRWPGREEDAQAVWDAHCRASHDEGACLGALALRVTRGGVDEATRSAYDAHLQAQCEAGTAWCWQQLREQGPRVASRWVDAFVAGCRAGDGMACHVAGRWYETGDAFAQDLSRATRYYAQACDLGVGSACYEAGANMELGLGGAVLEDALATYQRGCELGDERSCARRGVAAREAGSDDALGYFERACWFGAPEGCTLFADMVAPLEDYRQARQSLASIEALCTAEATPGACLALASLRRTGGAIFSPEPEEAASLYHDVCVRTSLDDSTRGEGCYWTGHYTLNDEASDLDGSESIAYWWLACQLGSSDGCEELGVSSYDPDHLPGIVENRAACDAGDMRACTNLGVFFSNRGGYERAVLRFRHACRGGDPLACHALGVHYVRGAGVNVDLARAEAFFEQACAGGHAPACSAVEDADVAYLEIGQR